MAGETKLTLIGNLVDDPEVRVTAGGHAVAKFRMASTPRTFVKDTQEWRDGDSLFLTVSAWRSLGEHCADSLHRGNRVIVYGELKQRSYEDRDGVKRVVYEIEAEDVAASLKTATAVVTKATQGGQRGQNPQQAGSGWGQQTQQQADPWSTQGSNDPGPGF